MPPFDRRTLRHWRDTALDLVFPPQCVACRRGGAHLCEACIAEFVPAVGSRCQRCWALGCASLCAGCRDDAPAFDTRRAGFVFQTAVRDAVLALKYQGMSSVGSPLVELIRPASVFPADEVPDLVSAVPMSGARRRRRGYNQADVLGRLLADRLQIPFAGEALRRVGAQPQQARQPDLAARQANVRHAFRAAAGQVRGRSVLVVDDVTTSCATLEACARALREAGAIRVAAWALAIED